GIGLLAEQILAGEPGIDRDHAVAALEQILEGEIARPAVLGGHAPHGDRLHGIENTADLAVVVALVVHRAAADQRKHVYMAAAAGPRGRVGLNSSRRPSV